jgi:hypothetical protein
MVLSVKAGPESHAGAIYLQVAPASQHHHSNGNRVVLLLLLLLFLFIFANVHDAINHIDKAAMLTTIKTTTG